MSAGTYRLKLREAKQKSQKVALILVGIRFNSNGGHILADRVLVIAY